MIKTRKEILEQIYDEVHFHQIQTELAHDSLQSKIITLIAPDAQKIRQELENKLAAMKNSMENDEKALQRILGKINELEKQN